MPSTDANTAVEHVKGERPAVIDHVLKYAGTDLLCYRAEEPSELRDRQHDAWQPLLDWAAETFGAHLVVTAGVVPVEQPLPGPTGSTMKQIDKKLESLGKDIGGALKGLFGK